MHARRSVAIADLRVITDLRAITDWRAITDLRAISDVWARAQVFDAHCDAPLAHSCACDAACAACQRVTVNLGPTGPEPPCTFLQETWPEP